MSLSAIRKNLKPFFSVFALVFAIAYFAPSLGHYSFRYTKASHRSSIEAFAAQPGTSVVTEGQQLYKITGFDYFSFDITLSISSVVIAQSKAFFISIFERNVFYVFTTINAP